MDKGKLYICPTPIGNLEDITFRVLKVLKSVDLIAAEDTRHTIKLLNYFEIKSKLFSYHEHNKSTAGVHLINELNDGKDIALVSDAGMPGISDPGEDLVKLCITEGIEIEALPGASAVITALAASGLSTRRFLFEGFLDRNKKERRKRLEVIKGNNETIVFYESPHRLLEMLNDVFNIMGDRNIVLAREITKKYEEYHRDSVSNSIRYFKEKGVRGEFVVIIEGSDEIATAKEFNYSIKEHIIKYMDLGNSKKDSISLVAKERDIPKKEVYNESLDIKK